VVASPSAGLPQERPSLFESEFAELSARLRGRGEFGGDWTRFRPCEAGLQTTCDPGLLPQLKPEVKFGIQVEGTVAGRIHVDVDYDEAREFSGANNVNIYYQGMEGEIVRRVEVGDVTLSFPESRFLTRGIPAGNFGFRALATLGPLDLQTVWAQQNGDVSSREFQLSGVGGRQAFIQEDTLVLDDADYVRGQLFFLVDPERLREYPHVDILSLDPEAAPPDLAPGAGAVQVYRFENDPVTRQQVEGYIQAEAAAEEDGVRVTESGWFRNLQPGVDYLLHPSGLWLALRRPLRHDEMLAVTFVTATGDTIGDYNPERIHNAGGRPTLRLLKASGPEAPAGEPHLADGDAPRLPGLRVRRRGACLREPDPFPGGAVGGPHLQEASHRGGGNAPEAPGAGRGVPGGRAGRVVRLPPGPGLLPGSAAGVRYVPGVPNAATLRRAASRALPGAFRPGDS
jgi:hypothetical protein